MIGRFCWHNANDQTGMFFVIIGVGISLAFLTLPSNAQILAKSQEAKFRTTNKNSHQRNRSVVEARPMMIGYRVESKDDIVDYEKNGSISVVPNTKIVIRTYGYGLKRVTLVGFTSSSSQTCQNLQVAAENLVTTDETSMVFSAVFPNTNTFYHLCFCTDQAAAATEKRSSADILNTTGTIDPATCTNQASRGGVIHTQLPVKEHYLPVGLQIAIIVVLMTLSGLFSGLNLGLMSLDKTELKIILKVGDTAERQHAKQIYPIRKKGNYLLCTLLLGNVVVNSAISILFDDLTSGLVALIFASLCIVVFGEIIPQAVCSRYGLAVGARTIWITRFFMVFTFPLSYPISKILDKVLGDEVRQVYNRERLLELIRLSKEEQATDLGTCQEVQIVTGALELAKKTVGDVMTPVQDVFMLSSDVILDPKTVSEIVKSGFTRIPVYDSNDRNCIVNMLNVKDLALLDPEDKIPLNTICQFYHHPVRFVMRDTPLGVMLEEFKKGHYHLAIVQQIRSDSDVDPVYEPVGLITLEDIIEEIIQAEIRDEFDIIRDTRLKRIKKQKRETTFAMTAMAARATGTAAGSFIAVGDVAPSDVSIFFNQTLDACEISPQLTLAAYQYLSTTLDVFRIDAMSENVLQRLIRQNVLKKRVGDGTTPCQLYTKGRESNCFVLILEGKCSIIVGESNLLFEAGPFCFFGYELMTRVLEDMRRRSSLALQTSSTPANGSICGGVQAQTPGGGAPAPVPLFSAAAPLSPPPVAAVAKHSTVSSPVDAGGRKFSFVPDFTLICDRQDVVYLRVTTSVYTKAYRATLIEHGRGGPQRPSMVGSFGAPLAFNALVAGAASATAADSTLSSPTVDVAGALPSAAAVANAAALALWRRSLVSSTSCENVVAHLDAVASGCSAPASRPPNLGSIRSLDLKSSIREENDQLLNTNSEQEVS